MKKIDRDGLLLCDLQAKAFELSVTMQETGSAIFIRRFMNSTIAGEMDRGIVLQTGIQPGEMLELVEAEYGKSDYGSVKYTENEMFWIGYIYRYFAYTYERSSIQVYKAVKPKELRDLFLPCPTMKTYDNLSITRYLNKYPFWIKEDFHLHPSRSNFLFKN